MERGKLNGTKRSTNKKKVRQRKRPKKQQQQQERLNYMFLGLIFILFGVFGLFRLGFLGTLLANCLRLVVGNTFPFCGDFTNPVWLISHDLWKRFSVKKRAPYFFGAVLIYISVLLFFSMPLCFEMLVAVNQIF